MRKGFTLAEQVVGAGLMLLVATFGNDLLVSVQRATVAGHARADATGAVVLAGEMLRRDAARMVVQRPSDLTVRDGGRGLEMLVARDALDADLWSVDAVPVRYRLVPAAGRPGVFQLERTDVRGPRVVPGCELADLDVRVSRRGEMAEKSAFLDLTLIGVSPAPGVAGFTLRIVVPITPAEPPHPRAHRTPRRIA